MSVFFIPTLNATNKNPKIVVIGAGLAGLTTAHRLQAEGMDVNLYEAKNRVGGRVFTVNLNNSFAELGAQNITDGGDATHIKSLISKFNLELMSSRVALNHCYFNGNDLIPISELLKNQKFDPETLRTKLSELAAISHNMKDVLGKLIESDDPLYKVLAVRLAAYEGATLEKLSPIYIETLFHMLMGGICSVHQSNSEEENYVDLITIKGGNSSLPEKIATLLGDRLHINMPLTKVKKNEDGSYKLTFQNNQEVDADILVLAIPCPGYDQIFFEDNVIPDEILKNIRNVQYGKNAKIMIPFFKTPSKNTGLVSDQIVSFLDIVQNILTIYYTDSTSFFSNETICEAYVQARPMIEKGFTHDCPPFEAPKFSEDQNFKTYHSPVGYSWPNDPYIKGSYSYIAAGQEDLLTTITEVKGEKFKTLFAPIQQSLYFAGEHTSVLLEVPGTMEAACESGERVARAILGR